MAALSVTAASVLPSSAAVLSKEYTAAAAITAGQAVYLNSSSQWALLDTNAAVTGNGVNDKRGIACNNAPGANQPLTVCLSDPSFTTGATMTNGKTLYGSNTPGGITEADLPTTGDFPVILGVNISTTKVNLFPLASGVII